MSRVRFAGSTPLSQGRTAYTKAPSTLFVQVKRTTTWNKRVVVKNSRPVTFERVAHLPLEGPVGQGGAPHTTKYRVRGFVVHIGPEPTGGRYVTYGHLTVPAGFVPTTLW
ncbi:unnamed protein product [Ectocarpus sp. 12 AP-2014]